MKIANYKKILTVSFLAIFLFMGSAHITSAANAPANYFACSFNPATCGIYILSITIQGVLGLFLQLAVYFIRIGLQVNDHIFDSPLVQTGFSVTLAIANLGFVLGIIIIAIATILRRENYGIKQVLWKLIGMAILVNFGLVIARPIVSFSDSLSNYFVTAVGGGNGYIGFANNISATFQPQVLTNANIGSLIGGTVTGSIVCTNPLGALLCAALPSIASYLGNTSASVSFTQTLLASVLGIILTGFAALTIVTLSILLMVRYVALGILLVLLPLAWLAYVFPGFGSHFQKWWSEFVRWTFFPPLMLFFIYLAFITASTSTTSGNQYLTATAGAQNSAVQNLPEAGLATLIGQTGLDKIPQAANELIILALMIGGVFAAASLSGKAGGVVVSGAKSAAGWVGGYVGRRTRQVTTAPLRNQGARQSFASMQQSRNFVTRWLGRGMENVAVWGGEKAAGSYDQAVGKLTREQSMNQLSTSNAMRRQAILKRADAEGWHDDARIQKYLTSNRESEAKRYGSQKTFESLRTKSGVGLVEAVQGGDAIKIKAEINKVTIKNPETLSSFFINDAAFQKIQQELQDKGIKIPLTLDPNNINLLKREVVKNFGGFSSSMASSLIKDLSKNNNFAKFQDAVADLENNYTTDFASLQGDIRNNNELYRYFTKNANKNIVDLKGLFKV